MHPSLTDNWLAELHSGYCLEEQNRPVGHYQLALQLPFSFEVGALGGGLVSPAPE
jgi:hypothetical protein